MYKIAVKFFVTGLFTGLSPVAPGTMGTILGSIIIYIATLGFGSDLSVILFFIMSLIFTILAIASINFYIKHFHTSNDPKEVVIDEIVGIWIQSSCTLYLYHNLLLWAIVNFIIFRFFDIVKIGPVRWCDQNLKGGIGVMSDDIAAALLGIILQISYNHFLSW